MDFFIFYKLAQSVVKEIWKFRFFALFIGLVTAIAFLVVGAFWQEKYETSASLYADEQNIISPLLEGRAQVTKVSDQLQIVRDIMLSQQALESIVDQEQGLLSNPESVTERSAVISGLRGAIDVYALGQGYIGVKYRDTDPTRSYNVVSSLLNLFLRESSESKRSESRQAFEFIEKQAASYKEQLRVAEQKLKEFNASNIDGTEGQAQASIESLRSSIEKVELDLGQARERTQSLANQVAQEDRYLTQRARSEGYNERIAQAVAQLDELRLSYTDSHPDVIAMKEHIQALRNASSIKGEATTEISTSKTLVENPVYDELRTALATARVERNGIQSRLSSLNIRLTEARERLQRIVARDAEFKELTRDYDVTKGLYEDLLQRKEKARLSMTLDIEGQGVTYKIQESPKYPLIPSGLRFLHFLLIGCAAAVVIPIALAIAYVMLDPRVRFASTVQETFDVPMLGEVPHLSSSLQQRLGRADARFFLMCGFAAALLYFALVAGYVFLLR